MFQTFFNAVLLCGVGYTLYKKVIQMLKDIDEKYEGKLKTLVFEMEVKHQVSINQLLKDIDEKYELKVNHQESIQKLENTIEYNLEHTETLAIDLNNKLRLFKNELLDKVKEDLVLSEDKIKDELLDKVKPLLEEEDEIVDDECSSICLSELSEEDEDEDEEEVPESTQVPTPVSELILEPNTKKVTILGKIYYCKSGRPFERCTLYELESKKEVGIYIRTPGSNTVELCENEAPKLNTWNNGISKVKSNVEWLGDQGFLIRGIPVEILGKNFLLRASGIIYDSYDIIYDSETKEKVCEYNAYYRRLTNIRKVD